MKRNNLKDTLKEIDKISKLLKESYVFEDEPQMAPEEGMPMKEPMHDEEQMMGEPEMMAKKPEMVIELAVKGMLPKGPMGRDMIKKPSKEFFDKLLETYQLDPKTCLMVGNDESADIQGARLAGMDSLYIHTEISPVEDTKSTATYSVMDGDWKKVASILLK